MIEWIIVAMALVTGFGIGATFGMIVTARKVANVFEALNWEGASREIQDIVRGACLDPVIRKKAAAAGKAPHVLDSRLGGHWAGRVLAAAGIRGEEGSYNFWFTTFQRDGWEDSYTDGLSGVWVVVADAIHDESVAMNNRDIRSMTFAAVKAYRDYMDKEDNDA